VQGDGDSAQKHREFYDEYLAVMDLAAEFYLQTVETVFVRHALPKGEMTHRGIRIDPANIRRVALLTVEGENDDISGVGQTEAAHRLCVNIPESRRAHWLQPAVGHYGVFNGSRFRAEIVPRVADFVLSNNAARARGVGKRAPKRASAPTTPNGAVLAPPIALVSAANEQGAPHPPPPGGGAARSGPPSSRVLPRFPRDSTAASVRTLAAKSLIARSICPRIWRGKRAARKRPP